MVVFITTMLKNVAGWRMADVGCEYHPMLGVPREYWVTCLPNVNLLMLPSPIRHVHAVCVQHADYQIRLVHVSHNEWPHDFALRGRPSWFRTRRNSAGWEMELWPTPDGPYQLWISVFEDCPDQIYPQVEMAFRYPRGDPHEVSKELLRSWLTPAQNKMLAEEECFLVKGSDTKDTYRISSGMVFNVHRLDKATGSPIQKLCFVPDNAPYVGDVMLAQKIMLETNEPKALRIANKQ